MNEIQLCFKYDVDTPRRIKKKTSLKKFSSRRMQRRSVYIVFKA